MITIKAGDENAALYINADGKKQELEYSMIQEYWSYGSYEEIEEYYFNVQGQYVVGSFLTADRQGGILLVWDTVSEKIVHVSDGEFVVRTIIFNGSIYSICDVMTFVTKEHLEFFKIPFGVMDIQAPGERVAKDANITADDSSHYVLEKRNGKLVAGYKDDVVVIA